MTHHTAAHRSQAMTDCINECMQCHAICLETINYCLTQGGKHAAPEHIGLMASCADICSTSADTMLRGSSIHTATFGSCAEICQACGDECAKHEMGHCQECAKACRRCAEECRKMAA